MPKFKTMLYIGGALYIAYQYQKTKKQIQEVGKKLNPANNDNYINTALGGAGQKIGSAIYDWLN